MKLVMIFAAALCVMVAVTARSDEPTTKPARKIKLTSPWSKLTDLTDEQRTRIAEIHDQYKGPIKELTDQEKVLRDKERAEIEATLTDVQKKELSDLHASQHAAHEHTATTNPAPATMPSGN